MKLEPWRIQNLIDSMAFILKDYIHDDIDALFGWWSMKLKIEDHLAVHCK